MEFEYEGAYFANIEFDSYGFYGEWRQGQQHLGDRL